MKTDSETGGRREKYVCVRLMCFGRCHASALAKPILNKRKEKKKRPLFRRLKTTKKNVSFPINCGSGLQISFPLHPTISVWVPVVAFLVSVLDVFLKLEHTSRF